VGKSHDEAPRGNHRDRLSAERINETKCSSVRTCPSSRATGAIGGGNGSLNFVPHNHHPENLTSRIVAAVAGRIYVNREIQASRWLDNIKRPYRAPISRTQVCEEI